MTTLVLLVLAVVWAAVLVSWIRSRTASSFGDSVSTFRRHIRVLERTSPTMVRPANRMRAPATIAAPPYRPTPVGGANRAAAAPPPGSSRAAGPTPPSAAVLRRRQGQRRRRDVLLFLVAGAAGTLVLSAIPGLHTLLYLQLVFDLLLTAYVVLLIRMRNAAAERDAKLAYLPRVRPVPAGVVRRGTGRYAGLSGAFDTGEMILGHAAN